MKSYVVKYLLFIINSLFIVSMKYLITILFLILTFLGVSQPPNDNCANASVITLPNPITCPNGVGGTVNVTGTNIGATAPSPYTYLLGCSTGGNQPAPALDVWYRFVATGTKVTINITGGSPALASPAMSLWNGTNCNNLIGVGCDNNGTVGGSNSATFEPLSIGQTYYIQISGMNSTAIGNFNMSINASNDCADCNTSSYLTVTPPPTNGAYLPGTQVTFCYTITNYTQVSVNWMHGVVPTFGNGWSTPTLISSGTPPAPSSGYGWYWANGPLGQGWWVDLDPVGPTGPDGVFNNNYGYSPVNGTGTWTWCWKITTKANCSSGTNLSMSINTTSDGETGSWTSPACLDDPVYQFSALLNCCTTTATSINPTCFGYSNGTATANPSGVSPYQYSWNTSPIQTTQTATNLLSGSYTVTVTDASGCVSTATVSLTNPPQILVGPINHN
jgi:hypothetical protein